MHSLCPAGDYVDHTHNHAHTHVIMTTVLGSVSQELTPSAEPAISFPTFQTQLALTSSLVLKL